MLKSYIIALLGIVAVMTVWTMVQNAWRTVFSPSHADPDVLAGRNRCSGCVCTGGGHCRSNFTSRASSKESQS